MCVFLAHFDKIFEILISKCPVLTNILTPIPAYEVLSVASTKIKDYSSFSWSPCSYQWCLLNLSEKDPWNLSRCNHLCCLIHDTENPAPQFYSVSVFLSSFNNEDKSIKLHKNGEQRRNYQIYLEGWIILDYLLMTEVMETLLLIKNMDMAALFSCQ